MGDDPGGQRARFIAKRETYATAALRCAHQRILAGSLRHMMDRAAALPSVRDCQTIEIDGLRQEGRLKCSTFSLGDSTTIPA